MEELKMLTVCDRLYIWKAKFMYKISKDECPPYTCINELFQERALNENVPTLRSSSEYSFITPRPYKEMFKQSITYSGPIIWNSLPLGLKSLDSIEKFHSSLIKWMKKTLTFSFLVCVLILVIVLFSCFLCKKLFFLFIILFIHLCLVNVWDSV